MTTLKNHKLNIYPIKRINSISHKMKTIPNHQVKLFQKKIAREGGCWYFLSLVPSPNKLSVSNADKTKTIRKRKIPKCCKVFGWRLTAQRLGDRTSPPRTPLHFYFNSTPQFLFHAALYNRRPQYFPILKSFRDNWCIPMEVSTC